MNALFTLIDYKKYYNIMANRKQKLEFLTNIWKSTKKLLK